MISQVPNPVPLIGWILPGENFMKGSPSRNVDHSYDHAFAVVPLNTRDEQGKVLPTSRALLIQSFGDGEKTLLLSVIDKRVFWTSVRAFVAARVWTDAVAKCFERAFGVSRSFPGRAMQPCFDAIPLMPPKCAKCNRVTPPSTCTRCHRVVYCTPQCQQADWSAHRADCEKYQAEQSARGKEK